MPTPTIWTSELCTTIPAFLLIAVVSTLVGKAVRWAWRAIRKG